MQTWCSEDIWTWEWASIALAVMDDSLLGLDSIEDVNFLLSLGPGVLILNRPVYFDNLFNATNRPVVFYYIVLSISHTHTHTQTFFWFTREISYSPVRSIILTSIFFQFNTCPLTRCKHGFSIKSQCTSLRKENIISL